MHSHFEWIINLLSERKKKMSRLSIVLPVKSVLQLLVLLHVLHLGRCSDITYYVEEGKSPGTLVGNIADDSRLLGLVKVQDRSKISFSQLGKKDKLFRISRNTGKLYTAQILDADSLCTRNTECLRIIKIAARQAKNFMKILNVKVLIKDINDHQPEFPDKQVIIEFSENDAEGTTYSLPNAIDKDVGILNSQITYQLEQNTDKLFTLLTTKSVDSISKPSIRLEKRLDREEKDSYNIQVVARDSGSPPKQSVLDVHISVRDFNDNYPVFSQKVYNISIKYEHDVATPIAILSATDLDLGKNGQISHHFGATTSEKDKKHFEINEFSGEVFLHKKITAGQKLSYKLYIEATDGGSPPLSSTAELVVNVINHHNNAPSIDVNFFSDLAENKDAISEDVNVGSFIAYVMVSDNDVGLNGEVSCNLYHDKFQLQRLSAKEYKITVKRKLDRETEDHHEISISCKDKGSPPLHSEKKFSIQVIDVNDVRPQFSKKSFKFLIYENQESHIPVGYTNASDPDLGPGGKLTYSLLIDSKHFLPFQIRDNALISTVMSLDHEFKDVYEFQVIVKDNGIPSLNSTVNVSVEVRDVNDNAPSFTYPSISPFHLDVIYYPHHTNNITVLKATDSDSQENAFLKYEIVRGNDKQLFNLNHYTGLLSFNRAISQQDAGSYDLEFVVKDSGTPVLSAKMNMILKLTVSNKTLEILNTKHTKTGESVHLFLLIIIIVVAVTVSVSITAAMSICFIRCKDRRDASDNDEVNPPCKCVVEHGKFTCSSLHSSSDWPSEMPVGLSDSSRSLSRRSRRELYPRGELGNGQKAVDDDYQEIKALSGGKDNEHKQFMSPDCHSEKENGWSRESSGHSREIDFNVSHQCKPPSSVNDPSVCKIINKKAIQQSYFHPRNANNICRLLHKANIGHIPDCSQWIDVKSASEDNSISWPGSKPDGKIITSSPQQQQHQHQQQQQKLLC